MYPYNSLKLNEVTSAYPDIKYDNLFYSIKSPISNKKGSLVSICPHTDNCVSIILTNNQSKTETFNITLHFRESESDYYNRLQSHKNLLYRSKLNEYSNEEIGCSDPYSLAKSLLLTDSPDNSCWAVQIHAHYDTYTTNHYLVKQESFLSPKNALGYLYYMLGNYYYGNSSSNEEFISYIINKLAYYGKKRYLASNPNTNHSKFLGRDLKKYIKLALYGNMNE